MKKNKGFMLIELILVIAISALIIPLTFNFLNFGFTSQKMISEEFDMQSDLRYTVAVTNNTVRFASVGFIVTEDEYEPQLVSGDYTGLAKPWNYIGLSPDKTELLHYQYDSATDKYKTSTLASAPDDITLSIKFEKADGNTDIDKKVVKYILEGKRNGAVVYSIITEIDAIASLNIVDWSDAMNNGVALAYRTEDTPEISKRPIAAMAMVLDSSGSMTLKVGGGGSANDSTPPNDSRVEIMKRSLKNMVSELRAGGNVYASLVPFSTNANIPHVNFSSPPSNPSNFRKIPSTLGSDDWEALIDSLKAHDGTNTGDGMRQGYYKLLDFNDHPPSELASGTVIKNYMVILVDGKTTLGSADVYSVSGWRYYDFVLDDENNMDNSSDDYSFVGEWTGGGYLYDSNAVFGNGSSLDTVGTLYVDAVGERLIRAINPPSGVTDLDLTGNVFVIGFSSVENDLESVKDIAKAVGITVEADDSDVDNDFINNDRIFIAKSENDLQGVFSNIGSIIMEELWQIEGPKLTN